VFVALLFLYCFYVASPFPPCSKLVWSKLEQNEFSSVEKGGTAPGCPGSYPERALIHSRTRIVGDLRNGRRETTHKSPGVFPKRSTICRLGLLYRAGFAGFF